MCQYNAAIFLPLAIEVLVSKRADCQRISQQSLDIYVIKGIVGQELQHS